MYESATELYHHGKRGQRWGIKHGPPYPLSRVTLGKKSKKEKTENTEKKEENTEEKKSKKSSKSPGPADKGYYKKAETLTNDELQERIDRLNLEKRYNDALRGSGKVKESRAKKAGKAIEEVAGNSLKSGMSSFGRDAVDYTARRVVKEITGVDIPKSGGKKNSGNNNSNQTNNQNSTKNSKKADEQSIFKRDGSSSNKSSTSSKGTTMDDIMKEMNNLNKSINSISGGNHTSSNSSTENVFGSDYVEYMINNGKHNSGKHNKH